jgi:spore germination protein KA
MLLLILMFELIKESGLRMPRALGQTVSIVGALIIGQAAVQAGIVSIPAVIVIAITAVSGYIINKLDNTILIVRLMLLIAANILGILGIVLVEIALLAYMCSLKSFGVPYLSPIAPLSGQDVKYVFVRMPIWSIFEKPETITRKYIKNIQNAEKK